MQMIDAGPLVLDWLVAGGLNGIDEIQGLFMARSDRELYLEISATCPVLELEPEGALEAIRVWRRWFGEG